MANAFYSILIIAAALVGLIRGFRLGISRQIASLLGLSFGAVSARVLFPPLAPHFQWAERLSQAPEFTDFTINLTGTVIIFSVVYLFFSLLSPIFRIIFAVWEVGIINRLLGSFLALVKNLLWISIFLNLILCYFPSSGLLYYERSNDGNLVGAVMDITPIILGGYGAEDFALFNQLKEAKSISCNFRTCPNVIYIEDSCLMYPIISTSTISYHQC